MKGKRLNLKLCLFGIIFGLLFSEILLRLIGQGPWKLQAIDKQEPTMHQSDPILGWENKPGHYLLAPYTLDGKPLRITFLVNGSRRTSDKDFLNENDKLILVGGSYTQGWAITDEETYGWKIQERYPQWHVLNFGTGGYGTYQCLLKLEKELPKLKSPQRILYGLIDHHEIRNVGASWWLRHLSSYSRRGHVDVPYATLDLNGKLLRHPPQRCLLFPFSKYSSVMNLLGSVYENISTRDRLAQKREVTEKILTHMDMLSQKYNLEFTVVFLEMSSKIKKHYAAFLTNKNISFVDCSMLKTVEYQVPGEGHPNAKMNAAWAQCMETFLNK